MPGIRARMVFQAVAALGLAIGGTAWAAYTEIEVKDGGSLAGAVTWSGKVPAQKTVLPATDQKTCLSHANQALVIDGKTLGVRNAVVSIAGIRKGKSINSKRVEIDQKDCIFEPRIVVVPTNGEVAFLNSDPVTHNIHTHSRRNRTFNMVTLPKSAESKGSEPLVMRVVRADRITVTCDYHSWMKAYVLVMSHPYVAVTDEKGRFSIADIPPGQYKVRVWHEQVSTRTRAKDEDIPMIEFDGRVRDVTIESGREVVVNFAARRKTE